MSTVGEAIIKLIYDGKQAVVQAQNFAKEHEKILGKIGGAAKTTGKAVAAGLSIGYATTKGVIAGFTADSIKAYSDFEQLWGGVQTLFGTEGLGTIEEFAKKQNKTVAQVEDKYWDMYDNLVDVESAVRDNADRAYRTAGLSMNGYMEQATSMASALVQSLGGDTEKAAKLADQAIIDMSDNANKMGTDISMIQNAYQGFAKGNFTMLDNLKLGYGGTKTEMERLLEDAEKLSGKKYDVSSYADIAQAIHVVQKNMHIAGTTAKEAGTTIQGSLTMTQAAWKNMLTVMAEGQGDIGPYIDNLITSIFGDGTKSNLGLFGNILPAVERAISGVAKALPKLIQQLVKHITPLLKDIIPPLMEATTQVFVAIMEALPVIAPILADGLAQMFITLIPYIPTILGAFFNAIFTFIGAFFGKIGEYIGPWLSQTLSDMANAIGQWFNSVQANISAFFGDFATSATNAIANFAQGFKNAIQNIKNWFASIPAFFAGVIGKISEKVRQFGAKVGDIIGGAFKAVVNGVLTFIENFINTPIRAINGLIETINKVPGIDLGRLDEFHLPRLAKGGFVTGSTLANIGENGNEAVIPLEQHTENWARPLASAIAEQFSEHGIGGAGITVYMTNNINNNLDADEIGQRLMTSIRRAA